MPMSKRRWALALAVAALVVLAGCSGSSGDAGSMSGGGAPQTASADAGSNSKATGSNGERAFQSQNLVLQQRTLIRTGRVDLRVDDFEASRRNLTREVRALGGFVSDSSVQVRGTENRSWRTGRVVFRVPKENFSTFLSRAKAEGRVEQSNTKSEDVTEKLVDLEARLKNLRAQRERLRALYQDANDTSTVLEVQQRLSEVQSEIERIEARRKSLRQRVAYSTVTVNLRESSPDAPYAEHRSWYETGLLAAFLESVNGVGVVLRGLAVGTAYAAPYVLAFGVPVGGVLAAWRRFG
ncbi:MULTISPECIES: DUF4349 domain-containing protein [Halorussus]|uniref:DUF4349 domain-containing protein n=1 Tax=Halorussus TaxID=1070314 RepID=UPI0020A01255|nr:DUF4349 domain-containing protein [Halorussus vallis]USZ76219.1 DUF4349 domain-containing protein [Halorussus vallis]